MTYAPATGAPAPGVKLSPGQPRGGASIQINWTGHNDITYDWNLFSSFCQPTINGCWLACTKMIYNWASSADGMAAFTPAAVTGKLIPNPLPAQSDLDNRVGDQDWTDSSGNVHKGGGGLPADERVGIFQALGFNSIPKSACIKWSYSDWFNNLKTNGPMMWTSRPDPKRGDLHMMLIFGVQGGGVGGGNNCLLVADPYNDPNMPTVNTNAIKLLYNAGDGGALDFQQQCPADGWKSAADTLVWLPHS
ncbi:MAG TPA: papain-like cysteine protease family protein [Planctomycetota bacterium]|nr:papain-like cysteine protease family protein [Planctomycetota bacterium]